RPAPPVLFTPALHDALPILERSQQRGGVRLQKTGADHDERQPEVEERQRPEDEGEMPQRDDRAADEDAAVRAEEAIGDQPAADGDRKSTRLNSSHEWISYAV